MPDQDLRIRHLFERYLNGSATKAERAEFYMAIQEDENKALFHRLMDEQASRSQDDPNPFPLGSRERMLENIRQATRPAKTRYRWIAAAASLLLVIGTATYYLSKTNSLQSTAHTRAEILQPAQQGVTLTMGKQSIALQRKHQGKLASAIVQQDSLLVYGADVQAAITTQTLTNNSNNRFSVNLADGSEAILDIGSSLSYPSRFTGTTREVTLTGQAYFKVAHQPGKRFLVHYGSITTEDIGTEFNSSAYSDEPAKTTLVSGAIKVNGRSIQPGEQAILTDGQINVAPANMEEVTAWLQDKLVFHHEKLENIMRTLARSYAIKVIWRDEAAKGLSFGGSVSRNEPLATVLNYFRSVGKADFHVEGKTVTVFMKH